MFVYSTCLFVVTLLSILAKKTRHVKIVNRFLLLSSFATMVLVAGLRAPSVGTDTRAYVTGFELQRAIFNPLNEPGYYILNSVVRVFTEDYWVLLTVIAIITVFCYMRAIYQYSVDPVVSLFIFITMGYYTFFFNGARQGIASAIYCLAFGALVDGNFKKYSAWVLLAFCFHKSVIIALPLYFMFRQKTTLKFLAQMTIVAIVGVIFFDSVLDLGVLISDKYSIYQELHAQGGRLLTLYHVVLCVYFLVARSVIPPEDIKKYDVYLNMLFIGTVVYVIVTLSGGYVEVTRAGFYFQVASMFLWPIVFKNTSKHLGKHLLVYLFLIAQIIYFNIFINKMAGLVPYQFNKLLACWFL